MPENDMFMNHTMRFASLSYLILLVFFSNQLSGYSTGNYTIPSPFSEDPLADDSVDFSPQDNSFNLPYVGSTPENELDTVQTALNFTSLLLVVNSSLAILDSNYTTALSSTIAEIMNLQTSNVAVKWSKTQNRRLLTLYVVLVEVEIQSRQIQFVSGINEMTNELKAKFSKLVLNGNATSIFRQNLAKLEVEFDSHIGIAAIQFAIDVHGEDSDSHAASDSTQSGWFSDFIDSSVDEVGGTKHFTIIMSCVLCLFLINTTYFIYYMSFKYCVGFYRWNKVIKNVSSMSIDHQVNPTIDNDTDTNSIIAGEFVLGSMSEDEHQRIGTYPDNYPLCDRDAPSPLQREKGLFLGLSPSAITRQLRSSAASITSSLSNASLSSSKKSPPKSQIKSSQNSPIQNPISIGTKQSSISRKQLPQGNNEPPSSSYTQSPTRQFLSGIASHLAVLCGVVEENDDKDKDKGINPSSLSPSPPSPTPYPVRSERSPHYISDQFSDLSPDPSPCPSPRPSATSPATSHSPRRPRGRHFRMMNLSMMSDLRDISLD